MGGVRECRGRGLARRALYDSSILGPGLHSNVFPANSIWAEKKNEPSLLQVPFMLTVQSLSEYPYGLV
jgi:hypothetical protein